MARDGDDDSRLRDALLRGVSEHGGPALPHLTGVHAVEIHERDRLVGAVGIRHARPQRPGHERQVRVGVAWFERPLLCGQLHPAVHLVVLVPRAFREHRPEDIDVGHDIGRVVLEAGGHTSIEITRGRVEGAAQRPRIGVEGIAESRGDDVADVDYVDPRAGRQFERELGRAT